jgi:hypothetical protein
MSDKRQVGNTRKGSEIKGIREVGNRDHQQAERGTRERQEDGQMIGWATVSVRSADTIKTKKARRRGSLSVAGSTRPDAKKD